MKKRLSKKVLAIFLAALMVATSIPFSVLHVFAADAWTDAAQDAEVTKIENKMNEFASTLSESGKAFGNVEPAYAAYVACREALDAYIYGGETDALDGKYDALESAMNAMTEFTGEVTITNQYDKVFATESEGGAGYLSNVIWAGTVTDTSSNSGKATCTDGYNALTLYYPEVTMLYDGSDTPLATKIMVNAGGEKRGKNRYVFAVSSTASDLTLNSEWKGRTGSNNYLDWNYAWVSGTDKLSNSSASITSNYQVTKQGLTGTTTWQNFFANQLVYSGTLASDPTSNPVYKVDLTPSFKAYVSGSQSEVSDTNGANVTTSGSTQIHVINYAVIKNAVQVNGDKMKTVELDDYSQGGLKAYFTAMDNLTSFNPNDYFTSSNNYSGYADEAAKRVNTANSAKTNGTNKTGYQALREAMSASVRKTYAEGGDKYTEKSWNQFVEYYKKCQELMAKVNDTGYNYASGNPYAESNDTLNQWAENLSSCELKTKVDKVDTKELEALIDDFESYDSADFTATSYNTFASVVKEIKEAIWQSESNYGMAANALDATDENKQILADNVAKFKSEFVKLRLSPDAKATTSDGRYTLNQALALEDEADSASKYTNYPQFSNALVDAKAYLEKLDLTPMTDYEAQMTEYRKYVSEVVEAYFALEYGFIATPNGTALNNSYTSGTGSTGTMNSEDSKTQSVKADYSSQGVILRTSHDAVNAKYGYFDVTFGTNVSGKDNNALDSISINATADKIGDNGSKLHINTEKAASAPTELSEAQKETYAGCLSYNNFNVNNIKLESYSTNCNTSSLFVTDKSGNKIATGSDVYNQDLTDILSTTEGQSITPIAGGVFLRALSDSSEATYTLRGDLNYSLGETQKQTLTESTVPTVASYTLGTKFGAVSVWTVHQTFSDYSAYNYYTSEQNGTTLDTTVQVLDVTPLVDLAEECNAMLEEKNKYTDASWTAFTDALEAAQKFPGYASMSADAILSTVVGKYTNLFNARKNLEVRDITYSFKYKVNELDTDGNIVKDSDGNNVVKDETRDITLKYGEVFQENATAFEQFNKEFPTYVSEDGLNTCTVDSTTWVSSLGIAFDPEAAVTEDTTFTCSYTQTPNSANWTDYNAAQSSLNAKLLQDETYTYDSLANAVKAVNDSSIKFYYLDADTKNAMMSDRQAEITAETQTLKNIADSLVEVNADLSVAKAVEKVKETQKADDTKKDLDMYPDASQGFVFTKTVSYTDVSTNEVFEVKGLLYSDADALDTAIKDYLNGLEIRKYDIYLNDDKLSGIYEYGTVVTVYADGTVKTGEQTDTPTGSNYAWTYSFSAPSRDNDFGKDGHDNKANATPEKYMLTAPALSFVVNGETYLKTKAVDSAAEGYIVTVKSGLNGSVLNVIQTESDGSFTLPAAPSIPFYTFDSYSDGFTAGSQTVSKNTTIIANYNYEETNQFTINVFNSYDSYSSEEPDDVKLVKYNELVTVSSDDAYCWTKAKVNDSGYYDFTVISYGPTYSFYASNSLDTDDNGYLGLVPITEDMYSEIQINTTSRDMRREADGTIEYVPIKSDGYDGYDHLLLGDGSPLFADVSTGKIVAPNIELDTMSLETPVYASDKTQMTFIGTFVLPEGYTMVESGFLFSGYAVNSTTKPAEAPVLELENVNNKSIRRLKSTKHTIGNQFVINVAINEKSGSCYYRPYTIFKKGDQKITVYGAQFAVDDIQGDLNK